MIQKIPFQNLPNQSLVINLGQTELGMELRFFKSILVLSIQDIISENYYFINLKLAPNSPIQFLSGHLIYLGCYDFTKLTETGQGFFYVSTEKAKS